MRLNVKTLSAERQLYQLALPVSLHKRRADQMTVSRQVAPLSPTHRRTGTWDVRDTTITARIWGSE